MKTIDKDLHEGWFSGPKIIQHPTLGKVQINHWFDGEVFISCEITYPKEISESISLDLTISNTTVENVLADQQLLNSRLSLMKKTFDAIMNKRNVYKQYFFTKRLNTLVIESGRKAPTIQEFLRYPIKSIHLFESKEAGRSIKSGRICIKDAQGIYTDGYVLDVIIDKNLNPVTTKIKMDDEKA